MTDWATLDEANKADNHYRRYPLEVQAARDAEQLAAQKHVDAVDEMESVGKLYERGLATFDDYHRAAMLAQEVLQCYLICSKRLSRVYAMWQDGCLAEQILDAELEQHYQDAEVQERKELWNVGRGA